ncbi:actin cytoskeleton-regulatory complex protein PAN1-like [Manduca sexta]|uniref:actin cytoskeleton-regulatory complex protein PAN1-like n=1 Tax=Manduca sexta TaxID=7130 RepID=UPI0018908449|nr:actin cytoskeleton-regulatory complex protein PAN1-like [Manduca sexta]
MLAMVEARVQANGVDPDGPSAKAHRWPTKKTASGDVNSPAPPQAVAGPSTAAAVTTASTARRRQDRRRETPKQKPQKGKKNGPPAAQPAPEPRVLPPAPANGHAVGRGGQKKEKGKAGSSANKHHTAAETDAPEGAETAAASFCGRDSDSSGSGSTVRSKKLWRRNSRSRHSLSQFTSDTDEPAPKTQAIDGRMRGRPPSVGKYVGLRKAQLERDKLQREEAKKKADKELEDRLHFVKSPILPKEDTEEDRPVLREDLRQCVQVVRTTVRKSGNLKGTSQKALNWVTNKIARYVDQPESAAIALLESEEIKEVAGELCPARGKHEDHPGGEYSSETTPRRAGSGRQRANNRRDAGDGRSEGPSPNGIDPNGPSATTAAGTREKTTPGDVQLPVSDGFVGGTHAKPRKEKGKGREKDGPACSGPRSCPHYPYSHRWAFQCPAASHSGPFYCGGFHTCDGASNREKTRKERRACKETGTRLQAEEGRKKRAGSSTRAQGRPHGRTESRGPHRIGYLEAKAEVHGHGRPGFPESGAEEAEFGGRKPTDGEVEKENTGAKPMEVATEFVRPPSLDSDSTTPTNQRQKSQTTDSRGRGRPPSVGKYVGLRKAQLERDKLQREEAKKRADKELEDRLHFVKSPILPKASETEDEDRPVLREDLRQCVQVVRTTVRKSGNLKGTSQKALNWVTNKIARYVDQPESAVIALLESETKKWQENCARLEANMKVIQEENTALKRRLEELEAAAKGPSTEEMLAMVEARVQARMESILMGPAQRPPLAHEKKTTPIDVELPVSDGYVGGTHAKPRKEKGKGRGKKTAQPAQAPTPAPTIPAPIAGPSSAPPQAVAGPSTAAASTPAMAPATVRRREKSAAPAKKPAPGSKPKKGGRKEPAVQPAPEPRPLPPAPASMETPWVEVARRKKKGKTTAAPTTTSVQPPKPSRRKEPKLRPPRSAAVVISLTPAAMAKGLTYKGVLTDAQNRVDLTGLDISRLKPKFTATGAPMYEVPGANSEERANSFAAEG